MTELVTILKSEKSTYFLNDFLTSELNRITNYTWNIQKDGKILGLGSFVVYLSSEEYQNILYNEQERERIKEKILHPEKRLIRSPLDRMNLTTGGRIIWYNQETGEFTHSGKIIKIMLPFEYENLFNEQNGTSKTIEIISTK